MSKTFLEQMDQLRFSYFFLTDYFKDFKFFPYITQC